MGLAYASRPPTTLRAAWAVASHRPRTAGLRRARGRQHARVEGLRLRHAGSGMGRRRPRSAQAHPGERAGGGRDRSDPSGLTADGGPRADLGGAKPTLGLGEGRPHMSLRNVHAAGAPRSPARSRMSRLFPHRSGDGDVGRHRARAALGRWSLDARRRNVPLANGSSGPPREDRGHDERGEDDPEGHREPSSVNAWPEARTAGQPSTRHGRPMLVGTPTAGGMTRPRLGSVGAKPVAAYRAANRPDRPVG